MVAPPGPTPGDTRAEVGDASAGAELPETTLWEPEQLWEHLGDVPVTVSGR
jgi:hypothetical protein